MQNTAHWFSMGNEFVSQGMSNNERRHLWLSRLGGWGEVMLVLWWTEARNAAKHPTVLGTASQQKLIQAELRNSGVRDQGEEQRLIKTPPLQKLLVQGAMITRHVECCVRDREEHYKDKAKRPLDREGSWCN